MAPWSDEHFMKTKWWHQSSRGHWSQGSVVRGYYWRLNQVITLAPRQNGPHFPDDTFKWIFLNENVWISIKISLKFVPRGTISNILALVQIMAWHRTGDKPLSEPMMVSLLMHICVTQPQWVEITPWKIKIAAKTIIKMKLSLIFIKWHLMLSVFKYYYICLGVWYQITLLLMYFTKNMQYQ